jgi:hypothetical protein
LKIEVYLNAKILEIFNFLTNSKLEIDIFVCYFSFSALLHPLFLISSLFNSSCSVGGVPGIPLYDIYRGGVLVMKILVWGEPRFMINISLCMSNDQLVNPLTRRTRMSQEPESKVVFVSGTAVSKKLHFLINISLCKSNDQLVNPLTRRTRTSHRTRE